MVQTFEQPQAAAAVPRRAFIATGLTIEAASCLGAALAPHWLVERIISPDGDVLLVVLAANDDPAMPTYLLHERRRVPHLATVAADVWESDRSFGLWPQAIEAVVALATSARPPSGGTPPDSTRALEAA
jgi:hypothetical protein